MALDVFAAQTAGIKPASIEETLRKSYLDYSMSVIVSRALPDARDGMKPVQRRILAAMNDLGLTAQAKYRKCAKVVGDCMGNYHPHGDGAIYDALVRLGQDFSVRYLLVDPQGNFGAISGDGAAAQRYTECRMGKIAAEMLADLDKETVDFAPNYDATRMEPAVLPAKAPMLLLNGATGIAVGMATSMPPHNLKEVCKGLIALLDNPDITVKDLIKHIPGPDFPTGGLICGRDGIVKAYTTGRGHLTMRAKCHVETAKNGRKTIVVTEIPYMMNLRGIVEKITDVYREGKIQGISDLNDNSNKDGVRISIELKAGEDADVIINQLYKLTPLQSTFAINNIALVKGRPETLTLKQLLECHRDHRIEVIRRRTAYLLEKAEARAHILEGLLKALDHIERIIRIIRESMDVPEARATLMAEFAFSEIQADAILNMPLRRLTGLQRQELQNEYDELVKKIAEYRAILADRGLVLDIIREDCHELIDKYADPRRTEIVAAAEDISLEDMIADEEMAVVVSHEGYIKRMALDVYRKQGRGGKGVSGSSNLKDGDFVEHLFIGVTKDYILFFTSTGQVHWLKVYEIPEMTRSAKGRSIANLLALKPGEHVSAMIPVRVFDDDHFLVLATRRGVIKKTALSAFNRPMKGGIRAININDGDELIGVVQTKGDDELMLASRNGLACRFNEQDVRPMGRPAAGVSGMNLADGDEVIGLMAVAPHCSVLTVSADGLGKRSDFADYRLTKRGAKGVINMNVTDKTGPVVACMTVLEDDEVMVITTQGMVVRTPVNGIRVIGRATQGVKVIRLKENDSVTAVARLVSAGKDESGVPTDLDADADVDADTDADASPEQEG